MNKLNRMMGLMDLLSVELLGWRFSKCCFFCWYLVCIAYAAIYLLCLLEGSKACKLWGCLTILFYMFVQCLTFNLYNIHLSGEKKKKTYQQRRPTISQNRPDQSSHKRPDLPYHKRPTENTSNKTMIFLLWDSCPLQNTALTTYRDSYIETESII